MDKEELLKQQEKLQREMDKLKELIEQTDNKKRWRVETEREKYYFLSDQGHINTYQEQHDILDNYLYSIGNYFKTKKEAERYKENIVTYQALKDLALELNNEEEIDWDDNENKYSISYGHLSKALKLDVNSCGQGLGQIYCLNKNFLNKAIEKIGEDRLIQLIKYGI